MSIREIVRRLRPGAAPQHDPRLQPFKLDLIDKAFARVGVRAFADLGGVWAVDAGYLFHGAGRPGVDRAVLVDDNFTEAVLERARQTPNVELVPGNFGTSEAAAAVGDVDAVLLFDVLLHQVGPDWDDVLRLYAPRTRSFVIVNPQWTHSNHTVRLVDLGPEEYLASVPPAPLHDALFDRLDEVNEQRGRPWRDVHDVWQWGVTDQDLRACAEGLGFRLVYYEDAGPWQGLHRFDNRAFVFLRD